MNDGRSSAPGAAPPPGGANIPAPGQTEEFERLRSVLWEMFQLDRGDLDFGLYRIMNLKRAEVERFLNEDLLPQARTLLGVAFGKDLAETKEELQKARESARALGMRPEDVPRVRELSAEIAGYGPESLDEGDVYSHLASFFDRYYRDGDFAAQRRYSSGGNTSYLIPYDGEEVKLHWANADQYYIKTTENYASYVFRAGSDAGSEADRRVRFEIVAAVGTRDNVKEASGRSRRFVLASGRDGVAVDGRDLVVRFEHRPLTDAEKRRSPGNANGQQGKINQDAAARILKAAPADWYAALAHPEPTESSPDRTTLDRHLIAYTAKNSFDYFIHKDLGGFLRREFDLYLKTDVLNLDDVEAGNAADVRRALARMKAIRTLGEKIIAFLAQLEDFQKRLWLKKKFVLETQYCVTLNRVPEALYREIAGNEAQRTEWERLYAISEIPADPQSGGGGTRVTLTENFLRANPYLVLDTRHFDRDFKDRLLEALSEPGPLDEAQDGLLIHGENFQALSLLRERYAGQVKCIYIDPPYNTGKGDFPYKDSYQRSSWIAMMQTRMDACFELLSEQAGSFVCHIDEHQFHDLEALLTLRFGSMRNVGPIIWNKKNPKGDARGVATQHEYVCWAVRGFPGDEQSKSFLHRVKENGPRILERAANIVVKAGSVTEASRGEFRRWVRSQGFSGGAAAYCELDDQGRVFRPVSMAWPNRTPAPDAYFAPLTHPGTGNYCPVPERGWRYPPETMRRLLDAGEVLFGPDETTQPQRKYLLAENLTENVPSLYDYGGSDDSLQTRMGYSFENAKPLPVAIYLVSVGASQGDELVLDCFAGSGVTGHAVMALNRRDGARRRYVLVEMADHFDTVLLPRMKKVVYSVDWKDGKPVSRKGMSQFFRYLRLESYEDTMDSLGVVPRNERQLGLHRELVEDYRLRYALNAETNGSASLLGSDFEDPFAYTLSVVRDGERRETPVDLPETFNLLLGLRERSRRRLDGVLVVEGKDAEGFRCLILWRNRREADNRVLDAWFLKHRGAFGPFDRVYANGDHTLNAVAEDEAAWRALPIEPTFRRLMFEER